MELQQKLDKVYILNPRYIMRNDINRIVFATIDLKDFESSKVNNIITLIHPVYAAMFSFFKGDKSLNENVKEISGYFHITYTEAYDLTSKFVDNATQITVEYDGVFFYLPKNILIENKNKNALRTYSADDFTIGDKLDMKTMRLNIPLEANILINNRCVTDCIYCYADKRKIYDCTIPLPRIKEIISEARELGITSFDIQGGEIFLYEYWYDLLKTLFDAGYSVYISTKCPIKADDIKKLVELGVKEIQISLDSIYEEDLRTNLRVGAKYHSEILNTIRLLNDNGLSIKLKAVITGPIFNIKKIEDYIDYFKQYEHVSIIDITAPAHSLYKTQQEFFDYRLNEEQINAIIELVKEKKDSCRFSLGVDIPQKDTTSQKTPDEKKQAFYARSRCTGNQSAFIILPNGDVSLCEETYFNKNLILGNVLKNSIMDVWNSPKAKNLFFIPQSVFPKESPCSTCAEFSQCRYDSGVCWTVAMAAYGEDNWLFPTPDCPYAPCPKNITNIW